VLLSKENAELLQLARETLGYLSILTFFHQLPTDGISTFVASEASFFDY